MHPWAFRDTWDTIIIWELTVYIQAYLFTIFILTGYQLAIINI